jgi:hypothetical protein
MRTVGIVLIVLGIAMILVKGFSVTTEKNIVDVGPVKIDKKENKWIGWPTYAGVILAAAGIAFVATDKKTLKN